MEECHSNCKILCISIDGINVGSSQLSNNKQMVDDRVKNNPNIKFVFINIKSFMDEFNSFKPARLVTETERLIYTLSTKICRALIDSEINPMNVMIVNYVKFRNAIEGRKEDLIQVSLPHVLLTAFEPYGYGDSVYDWFGYFYNLSLKHFIYKTKLISLPPTVFTLFLYKVLNLMRQNKLNNLYDATPDPQMFSIAFFSFFKSIYPISFVPFQVKNSIVDNNFTYSVANFLDNDPRQLVTNHKLISSGGSERNSGQRQNKNTFNNKTKKLANRPGSCRTTKKHYK
ncbi:MAG: hypothetical protein WD512_16930 [Candidatus Paceibacterota bacterium]